jgi:hypothetical protein
MLSGVNESLSKHCGPIAHATLLLENASKHRVESAIKTAQTLDVNSTTPASLICLQQFSMNIENRNKIYTLNKIQIWSRCLYEDGLQHIYMYDYVCMLVRIHMHLRIHINR